MICNVFDSINIHRVISPIDIAASSVRFLSPAFSVTAELGQTPGHIAPTGMLRLLYLILISTKKGHYEMLRWVWPISSSRVQKLAFGRTYEIAQRV